MIKEKHDSCKYCMSITLRISSSTQLNSVIKADLKIHLLFLNMLLIVGRCML